MEQPEDLVAKYTTQRVRRLVNLNEIDSGWSGAEEFLSSHRDYLRKIQSQRDIPIQMSNVRDYRGLAAAGSAILSNVPLYL